jgi:putative FmdB family regulatory protein
MPIYEYKCTKCGNVFEKQQLITDEPVKRCPKCQGKVNKIFSAAGIIFKGSGFHNTDYTKHKAKGKEHKTPEKPALEKKAQDTAKSAGTSTSK